jgi:ABC-2 type transport system ATP-binding protein
MNPVLQVKNLVKSFKRGLWKPKHTTIVNNISFEVGQGEIVGLLGPNGAGKTTTIQMLLSTMTPTSGQILYFGKDLWRHRSEVLQHVSFASTYVRFPGRLTVYENIDFYGKIYGLSAKERQEKIKKFLGFFNVWYLKDRPASVLSAGETTRVMLAKAFLASPKIVLLDEPTAALDPDIAQDIRRFILEQRRLQKTSILFTSHNMAEVSEVCDRVLVLKRGTIIEDSTPDELAASVSLAHLHLTIPNPQAMARAIAYVEELDLHYYLEEEKFLSVETDEHKLADFLTELTHRGIVYSQISIDKPTLEDYFLSISKS